jgi:hypothetical protein
MATKAATAWGEAAIVDELRLPQAAGEREFAAVVQLLADGAGRRYVRFAYTTDGVARRGPVTFREEDLARLGAELGRHPELAGALRLAGAGAKAKARARGGGGRKGARG